MAASNGNVKSSKGTKKNTKGSQHQSQKASGKQKRASVFNAKNATVFLCLLGISVSVLALYIEIMKERNPNYVALCDINSYITCSKVLTSRYGKGFGIVDRFLPKDNILNQPNTVYGIAFYLLEASLALISSSSAPLASFQLVMAVVANLGSIYLGYILFYVLEDFCLICISTYTINFLVLLTSIFSLKSAIASEVSLKSKKKR